MLPSDKELLDEENRKNVTAADFDQLVGSINSDLEDKQLLGRLRQVRNLFANGGDDLKFKEENLKCDFDAVAIELFSQGSRQEISIFLLSRDFEPFFERFYQNTVGYWSLAHFSNLLQFM